MKVAPRRIEAVLARPPAGLRAILLYGPDRGLIRERADAVVAAMAGRPPDPFRIAELTPDALKADPARLLDEAAALSFTGGRRLIRLRDATDGDAAIIEPVLTAPSCDALLLIEAGELPPRSALRRLAESSDNAAAVACYADEAAGLDGLIADVLGARALTMHRDAGDLLRRSLGADRGLSRQELEKLAVYTGDRGGEITVDDVTAVIADSALLSVDSVAFAAGDGDMAALDRALAAALAEGVTPVRVLRATAQHLQRLLAASLQLAAGRSPQQAMATLKPKVFYRHEAAFATQMRRWSRPRLHRALDLLVDTEFECKTTGAPQDLLCARVLLQIARAARAG
jgi:DNA polymerase III subunit delta